MSQAANDKRKGGTRKAGGLPSSSPSSSADVKSAQQSLDQSRKLGGLDAKVQEVREVTAWPDEDIKRVLEKYGGDTQLTIDAILEGREGASQWTDVSSRKKEKEAKPKNVPISDNKRFDGADSGRKPRKPDSQRMQNGDYERNDRDRRGADRRPPQRSFNDSPNGAPRGPRRGPGATGSQGFNPAAPSSQPQGLPLPQPQPQLARPSVQPSAQPAAPQFSTAPQLSTAPVTQTPGTRPPSYINVLTNTRPQAPPQQPPPPQQPIPQPSQQPQQQPPAQPQIQAQQQQQPQSQQQPQQQPQQQQQQQTPQQPSPQQQQQPQQTQQEAKSDSPTASRPSSYHNKANTANTAWVAKPKDQPIAAQAPQPTQPTLSTTSPISSIPANVSAPSSTSIPAAVPTTHNTPATVTPIAPSATSSIVPSAASVAPSAATQVQPQKSYIQPIQAPTSTTTPPSKRHPQFDGHLLLPSRAQAVDSNVTSFQFGSLTLNGPKKEVETEQPVPQPSHTQSQYPTPTTQQHTTQPQSQGAAAPQAHTPPVQAPVAGQPIHSMDPNQPHMMSNPEDMHAQLGYHSYYPPNYMVQPMSHFGFPEADADPRMPRPMQYYDPNYSYSARTGSPAGEAAKFAGKYNGTAGAPTQYRDAKYTAQDGSQSTQSPSQQTTASQSPPPQSPPQYPPPAGYSTQPVYYPYVSQYPYQGQSQYSTHYQYYAKPPYNYSNPAITAAYPTARPHTSNTQAQNYPGEEEYKNLYVQQHPSYSPFFVPGGHDANIQQQQQQQQQQTAPGKTSTQLSSSPPNPTASKQPTAANTFSATTAPSSSDYSKGSNTEYSKYGQQQPRESYYGVGQQQYGHQQFMGPPQPFNVMMSAMQQQGAAGGAPSQPYHGVPSHTHTQAATTLAPSSATSQGRTPHYSS